MGTIGPENVKDGMGGPGKRKKTVDNDDEMDMIDTRPPKLRRMEPDDMEWEMGAKSKRMVWTKG